MDIQSIHPCTSTENKEECADYLFVFVYKLHSWLWDLAEKELLI